MLDYQRIVDDVRNSLFVQGMEDADYLRAIVADFAVACEEVNERLQQCEALLRRGLRSEALHVCEIEPNLLDAVASLDFPERQQWEQFIGQFGLVPPLPVNVETAEALSEAYATEQPMAKLLRNHRLLALARGPLSDRIGILRRLADADPANSIWTEDVDAFERVRLEQIRGEAIAAGSSNDLATLRRLHQEVYDPSWRNPPAGHVVETVTTVHNRLLHAHVRLQVEATEHALNDAFSAFDVDRGRELRQRWNELLATPGFTPANELCARAAPALEWLEEQDELQQRQERHVFAIGALEQALDRGRPLEKLERLYHDATRDGENLSSALERRYQSRVASLKLSAARRLRLSVLAIAGTLALLAAGVWWAIDWQLKSGHLEQVRMSFAELIELGDLVAADSYRRQLEEREPGLLEQPPIAALAAALDRAIRDKEEKEGNRLGALGDALARVEKSLSGDNLALLRPDSQALELARSLAVTNAEKLNVVELQQQVEAVADARKKALDEEFEKLGEQIEFLEDRSYANITQYGEPIQTVRRTLVTLQEKVKELEAPGRFGARTKDFSERVAKLTEWVAQCEREEHLIAALTRAIGDCAAYHAALQAYVEAFATSPRAPDFRRVAENKPTWEALTEFGMLVDRWQQEVPAKLDPDKAKELLAAIGRIRDLYPGTFDSLPFAKAITDRTPLLEAIAKRGEGTGRAALGRELNQPIMRDCWCITDRARGKRYYVTVQPVLQPGHNTIQYIMNRAGDQRGAAIRGEDAESAVAPHVALSSDLRSMLAEVDHQNWESQLYQIMETIYRAKDVDDLLRFDLLRMALKTACDGSYPMAEAFKGPSAAFGNSKVNLFANWMDPNSPEADEARRLAGAELNTMPSFAAGWKEAQSRLEALQQPPGAPHRWAGWLRKNLQGKWESVMAGDSSTPADVFVFSTDGGQVQRLRLGSIEKGNLASPVDGPFREGMPLFVGPTGQKQP